MRPFFLLLLALSLSYCARPVASFSPETATVAAADTVRFRKRLGAGRAL